MGNLMKIGIMMLLLGGLLSSCSSGEESESEFVSQPSIEATVIADSLKIPWSIQKAENDFYLTERTGTIVEIKNGQKERVKVQLSMPLAQHPEAGLLGFVLHPEFKENHQAIAYYTYEDSDTPYNRIVALKREEQQWVETKVLLDRIPSGQQYHHGGRLKIGPDQKLYITTGDATKEEKAQELTFLGGKILRMNLDGTNPINQPFKESFVYSYGHRNPQGLAWNADGVLYGTEHGPNGYDEINLIEPGKNYGWPLITGEKGQESLVSPLAHSGKPSWAPSGADFWNDKLLFATLAGQSIKQFDPETKKVTELFSGFGRIRDVLVEGDTLFFVSNNTDGRGIPREKDDKLYKVDLTSFKSEE
ncbi:PQQ-dependent sugar dehydrogenase [Rossellomorea aquimaris]|uniref:PQQ-dependent sugar dehydrogenase n=1 Tax=Rossellomorea aquimaris TaxID=189382 RepID=UPI000ABD96FB|nr:sorbosone dehydrogenase family protein [Rossellomorea aquimaris]